MKAKSKIGMGFKKAAASISKKQGIPIKAAGAILAVGARKASAKAKAMIIQSCLWVKVEACNIMDANEYYNKINHMDCRRNGKV